MSSGAARYRFAERPPRVLNSSGLKPCPFCGEPGAVAMRVGDWGYSSAEVWSFCCADLCIEGRRFKATCDHPDSPEIEALRLEAVNWWNRRQVAP